MSRAGALAAAAPRAPVTALSHDGRGIARVKGKTLFIEDALPGEEVSFRFLRRRRDFDEAQAVEIIHAAAERVTPRCAQYGVCGGCVLQHLDPAAQVAAKQRTLLDNLRRIGGVSPDAILPPLLGPIWGYRRRARLSVHSDGPEGVRVGFTERHRPYVTATERCHVLDPKVGELITPLAELISSLSISARLPQIEVAVGDATTVLLMRVLSPASEQDKDKLVAFEIRHGIHIELQSVAGGTGVPLHGESVRLHYRLTEPGVDIDFQPMDFIQVNGEVNSKLVQLALRELDPQPDDALLDLFSGLGNFTLPLARQAASVTGVEGELGLVQRARANAERNGLSNAGFEQADLFATEQSGAWAKRKYARILLDPPRAGAREVIGLFPRFEAVKLVYVSCHPATLARDVKVLVEDQGWRLARAGVLDMFPHTAHVESIAVLERS
jgi:23S rRNA (uracil1939-C5)-methyltransferase